MNEEFLYYLWAYYLAGKSFTGTNAENILIEKTGLRNTDSGPDFFNGRIWINNTLWAGNIEMHVYASDWLKHGHQNDVAYDNVILHVVYEADISVKRQNGDPIPTLELKGKFDENIFLRYQGFILSDQWIPCQNDIADVNHFELRNWLYRLSIERLEEKSRLVLNSLANNKSDFNEVFYIHLLRSFGFKTNSEAFEQLGRSLPYMVLAKHKSNLTQIEALLFGQAGLLRGDFKDNYPNLLKAEYKFLAQKYSLRPLNAHIWKFMRMRPANFPSIRMAQFAQMIYHSSGLIHKILEAERLPDIVDLFRASASAYWQNHFRFDHTSPPSTKALGKLSIHLILINTIIPFIFVYGQNMQDEELKEKALRWLEALPAEKNGIISHFNELGIVARNAMQSQALIQLKNAYCNKKRCLHCSIGHQLLKSG